MRLALALVVGIAASANAHAQCNLYRGNVPDFDQKRAGLPEGGGSVHCVPTSAINWMGYISNNGWPLMMSGPRNWQSASNYNYVTSQIEFMGNLMDTNLADGGTTGGNGIDGLRTYLFVHGPYLFTASYWYGEIAPFDMYFNMLTNGLVNVCYGYYQQSPAINNQVWFARNGGHCTTLNGIEDVCTSTPRVRLRNPADDNTTSSQSTFVTVTSETAHQSFYTNPILTSAASRWRLTDFGVDSTTRRYLDCMFVIRANFACWAPATITTPSIVISKAITFANDPQAATVNIPTISGQIAKSIALHPKMTEAVYLSEVPSAAGNGNRLYLVNLGDGTQTQILAFPGGRPLPFGFNRMGDLYVGDGSVLKAYDITTNPPTLKFSRSLASAPSSIAFDDALDEVVVVTPANRRMIRMPHDLSAAIDEPLPTGVPAMGDGSVVPDPTAPGKYLLNIVGSPTVHQLALIAGTPRLQLENGLLLPAVHSVQSLHLVDGGVAVLCDGSVKILDRDPASGQLRTAPTQPFAGLPAVGGMTMSCSRTNFNPAIHTGPAWAHAYSAEHAPSVPDCKADFDGDSRVSTGDVFAFLNAWFANTQTADINNSGDLDTQDIFDFLNLWFAGC